MNKLADINVRVDDMGFNIITLYDGQYQDGAYAVLADFQWDDGDVEPNQILSVNIVEHSHLLKKGEFFLKNWSERETTAKALIDSGIVKLTGKTVRTGFVEAPIVQLNIGNLNVE